MLDVSTLIDKVYAAFSRLWLCELRVVRDLKTNIVLSHRLRLCCILEGTYSLATSRHVLVEGQHKSRTRVIACSDSLTVRDLSP